MARVISFEELNSQGISAEDFKKSLTLKYQAKTYRRRADLPKKFREKAMVLCEEIAREGKDSFVTETSFSYTVWEEEIPIVEGHKNTIIREIEENYVRESPPYTHENITSAETAEIKEEMVNRQKAEMIEMMTRMLEKTTLGEFTGEYTGEDKKVKDNSSGVKKEYNLFQYTQEKDSSLTLEDAKTQNRQNTTAVFPEDVIKYRGVAVNQVEKPTMVANPSPQTPKKTRVYRGVVY
ncbi:MAG: hypothetical protein NZ901_04245 [Geminocystis sp.]|nr:hypothetical protein [Geminocystis sp.]HIK38528.1 hypothetical protein [Geminocystis sp. M7585_C2015_104]MCS7147383.1 hypothetical protein [Geminocystis sp.]MCX8079035.1 hypothetical protein [Geminocystis sp.]MDW8117073.1 hypothetical protein [Geminocystis sp.]